MTPNRKMNPNTPMTQELNPNDSSRKVVKARWLIKKDKNKSTKREWNVLSNFFNPTKCAKSKTSHYSPILQVCMNTRSGRVKF